MKMLVNGIVAALLAVWAIPYLFDGFYIPVAYGWVIALAFVAVDVSWVSVSLARVEARRTVR